MHAHPRSIAVTLGMSDRSGVNFVVTPT